MKFFLKKEVIPEPTPPKPITLEDIKTKHTEELLRAESERIISLLLEHIKDLNNNLTKKIEEIESLEKKAIETQKVVQDMISSNVSSPRREGFSADTEAYKTEKDKTSSNVLDKNQFNKSGNNTNDLNKLDNAIDESGGLINNANLNNTELKQEQKEFIDPNKTQISYELDTDTSKEFMNNLSILISEVVSEKMKRYEKEIIDEISVRLKQTKAIFSEHVSFVKTDVEPNAKKEDKVDYFYLMDGTVIKSIDELYNCLTTMDDATYYSHVTSHRNDFANWIEHSFKEKNLAERIRMIRFKAGVVEELRKWLSKPI